VSALAQLLRNERITVAEFGHAKAQAECMSRLWRIVEPSARIALKARADLEKYALRAADGLQLAAALEWCECQPSGRAFLTFDQRLREAARDSGFALE
jgi:predicted nucleic acid-binding protein